MTDTKFTPGPLRVSSEPNSYGSRAITLGSIIVAQVWIPQEGTPTDSGKAERDANAYLFAAAPTMFAALANIVSHVEQEAASLMSGPWWRERRDEIRAAMAAARGEGR